MGAQPRDAAARFLRTETGSAAVLLAATLAALVWANVGSRRTSGSGARRCRSRSAARHLAGPAPLGQQRADDVLLLRRRPRGAARVRHRRAARAPPHRAAVCSARLGGMVGPDRDLPRVQRRARPSAHGWGAAMSTDTAFALGMLALVGPRFPDRLRAFMLTVSVVDDIVALVVIATVYTSTLALGPLLVARRRCSRCSLSRCAIAPARAAVRLGARAWSPWVALFESGVDPVVVGLAIGLADVRLAGDARRPRARHRPLPAVPRAADARARALGAARRGVGDLAERAPAAALPPVDELRDRPAVRARQRGHRVERRLLSARTRRRSRWASWSATSSASRSAIVVRVVAR